MKTTKFKPSEVGPIPEEWEVKRIGDVGAVVTGSTPPRNDAANWGGDFNWISAKDFCGKYITETEEHVTAQGKKYCRLLPENAVLVTCIASIGLNAIAKTKCATNQQINAVVCDEDSPEYIYYQICHSGDSLKQLAGQTAVPIIGKRQFEDVLLPVPPRPEQEKIAEALSDVDALLAAMTTLIEKKRAIKQGAMQQLLTGKKRLAGFSGKWVEKRLGDVLEIGNGKDYKYLGPGPIPVYGTGGLMTYVDEYLHDGPTVCIGRKGTIDQPQYHEGRIWTVDTLFYTYDFKGTYPKYLYYLFTRIDWHSYNTATGVPSLTAKSIAEIEVRLPEIAEQKAIAAVLSDMDAEIAALEAKRAKYESIKQGMMQELLTGKTRLG